MFLECESHDAESHVGRKYEGQRDRGAREAPTPAQHGRWCDVRVLFKSKQVERANSKTKTTFNSLCFRFCTGKQQHMPLGFQLTFFLLRYGIAKAKK